MGAKTSVAFIFLSVKKKNSRSFCGRMSCNHMNMVADKFSIESLIVG